MTIITEDDLRAIQASGYLEADWYLQRYPDVVSLGMDPIVHYLKYGAALGRNPSKRFNTEFYIKKNMRGLRGTVNPLIHYIQSRQSEGIIHRIKAQDPVRRAHSKISNIRRKLTSFGFTLLPLQELHMLVRADQEPRVRAMAAWEIALWHMTEQTEQGYRDALDWLAAVRQAAPDFELRCRLVTIELLCHHFLTQELQGQAAYERAALAGEMTSDAMLAWVNFQNTPEARIAWINEVLRQHNIPSVALGLDVALSPYDRLQSSHLLPVITEGPKVTVLIAAHNAAATISTALRSLQEQTWQNLEIIVIDDNSPTDDTCDIVRSFASSDPRISLIKMATNGGAYLARNHGLDHATGTYVTVHDADDWSHPLKIEMQVRHLQATPHAIGCTSEQARATSALYFTRLTGGGTLISENVSSFLWRREPVREALGYWDTVRFSADNELIRRVKTTFGNTSVQKIRVGPLSFQRHSQSSIMADDVMGMRGFYHGARKEYFDAQKHYHASGKSLKYDNNPSCRPFPAPILMRPDRKELLADRHFDVIIAGDFRALDENLCMLVKRVRHLRSSSQRVGLLELTDYHSQTADHLKCMHPALRSEIDGERVEVLVYGDKVTCDRLDVVTPGCDLSDNRYVPEITVRSQNEVPSQTTSAESD